MTPLQKEEHGGKAVLLRMCRDGRGYRKTVGMIARREIVVQILC